MWYDVIYAKALIFAKYINQINVRLDQMLLDILYNTEYLIQWVCWNQLFAHALH